MFTPIVNLFVLIFFYKAISEKLDFDLYDSISYFLGAVVPFFVPILIIYFGLVEYLLNYQWVIALPFMFSIFFSLFLLYHIKVQKIALSQFLILPLIGLTSYAILNFLSANQINSLSPFQIGEKQLKIFNERYLVLLFFLILFILTRVLVKKHQKIQHYIQCSVFALILIYFSAMKIYAQIQINQHFSDRVYTLQPLDSIAMDFFYKSFQDDKPIRALYKIQQFKVTIEEIDSSDLSGVERLYFNPRLQMVINRYFLSPEFTLDDQQTGERIIGIRESIKNDALIQLKHYKIEYNRFAKQINSSEKMTFSLL